MVNATEVTAGLAESNGSLLLGLWRDSLYVACGLTACTSGSTPGPTLGNEYGKTLPFFKQVRPQRRLLGGKVLWKETALPSWRATDIRWNR